MIVVVEVGVALSRPPKVDRISKVIVEADSALDGELLACRMVCRPDVVMPVYSKLLEVR
jgi:hypothetical protein